MLLFAASDKGGTGRSITCVNIAYQCALRGMDVCYADFDFGSPTAGALFSIAAATRGTGTGGLHSYLRGNIATPARLDVWTESEQPALRTRPASAGRLTLVPGDRDGFEFPIDHEVERHCVQLLLRLLDEHDLVVVDLSAGRSFAMELALRVTAGPELRDVLTRWLVFHRWTRQHILAAHGLVYSRNGLLDYAKQLGHRDLDTHAVRFVRTAVIDPRSDTLANLRGEQLAWLRRCEQDLQELASQLGAGRTLVAGTIPLDPVLQWREQVLTDNDLYLTRIANPETISAFQDLARRVADSADWQQL
ncbi:SCO2523 family variant P-loop protein [Longispora albida]|uniref:SCO2523 family variant P-loop protein n=1 Tax=Longispora albida TaxID=203523 RepID=UPI0003A3EFE0|nr:SCO2523 family variant P-loop protein [Longispora albida]